MHPLAKWLLFEVERASTRKDANRAIDPFVAEFEPKGPKAAEKVVKDREELLAFYDFPAEHWRHLRTTNPIESSSATVKLRTQVTKSAGSKDAALAIAYKLLDAGSPAGASSTAPSSSKSCSTKRHSRTGIRVTNDDTTTTDERVAA